MQIAQAPAQGASPGSTPAPAAECGPKPALTIERFGVLVFLRAANEAAAAAEQLWKLYSQRRNKATPAADALATGAATLDGQVRDDVKELRDRGGLLHFRMVRIERTDLGDYVVRRSS